MFKHYGQAVQMPFNFTKFLSIVNCYSANITKKIYQNHKGQNSLHTVKAVQIFLQFDEFFDKCLKIIISRILDFHFKSFHLLLVWTPGMHLTFLKIPELEFSVSIWVLSIVNRLGFNILSFAHWLQARDK